MARPKGSKDKQPRKRKGISSSNSQTKNSPKGVWFGGRRTAILVRAKDRAEAIRKAKKKLKRGESSKANVRNLTSSEIKSVKGGKWLRTGYKHQKPGYKGIGGYGPALKKG
jgi:hypothetical protein